jgi:RNA polymerase sigma-70 factor (ECF subfamily)
VLPQPDPEVVRQAQRGDAAAFSELVRAYEEAVFNYVNRLVGDRGLAEDLTQEVFLRVHQSLPGFSFRSKFTTWLFQVTKNRVFDEFRARERRPKTVELDSVRPLVADAVEPFETVEALWRAIERLDVDLKTPLLLRDVVGLSYSEIEDCLEISLPLVKWRIFKAREGVRLALAREGIRPGSRAELGRAASA